MIVIAGGRGRLGQQLVHFLTASELKVRVLTREPDVDRELVNDFVEFMPGNVRDPAALERAVAGAKTVISAIHGFAGTGDDNPRTVDWQGNSNLIRAAQAGGAEHFILISIHGAAPRHSMELLRMKYMAEQELRASKLPWTIIRPTAYMETWAQLIGEPLIKTGKSTIFGRGDNPINFVSVSDVARFVELAVADPRMRSMVVEVGGPQNLSMNQFAQTFQTLTGKMGKISHVPIPMMRVMAVLMRPLNPTLARQIGSAMIMDTEQMSFNALESRRRYPSIHVTSLADVVRRDYLPEAQNLTSQVKASDGEIA